MAPVRFIVDFVVGDDPWIAACVVVAFLATLLLANHHIAAWWLLPVVVAGVLGLSIVRAAVNRRLRGS